MFYQFNMTTRLPKISVKDIPAWWTQRDSNGYKALPFNTSSYCKFHVIHAGFDASDLRSARLPGWFRYTPGPRNWTHFAAKNFQGSILVFRGGIQQSFLQKYTQIQEKHHLCWSAFLNMIMFPGNVQESVAGRKDSRISPLLSRTIDQIIVLWLKLGTVLTS